MVLGVEGLGLGGSGRIKNYLKDFFSSTRAS